MPHDYEELIPASDEYRKTVSEDHPYEGKIVERRPFFLERVIKFLIADEVDDLQTYLIKKAKAFVKGIAGDFLGRISDSLVGSSIRDGRRGGYYDDGYTSYGEYYERKERNRKYNRDRDDDRPRLSVIRSRFDIREYGFERRRDAQEALEEMRRYVREKGRCRVDEYYYICTRKEVGDFTDRYYGWRDVNNVTISCRRDGRYYLDLPRPIELDRG